jgi:hypothetical protein
MGQPNAKFGGKRTACQAVPLAVGNMSRVVSIASVPDSDSSGDKLTASAKISPLYFKFDYRDH